MKKLNFKTRITAPAPKVWDALWQDKNYRDWTSVFSPGSYAESDWKEGSSIRFLSPEGEGMVSEIAKKVPNEYMSFRHLGMVKGGKEIFDDPEIQKWKGAMENYSLREQGGGTEVEVEVDIAEEHEDYFRKAFPEALKRLKEIAEKN